MKAIAWMVLGSLIGLPAAFTCLIYRVTTYDPGYFGLSSDIVEYYVATAFMCMAITLGASLVALLIGVLVMGTTALFSSAQPAAED